MSFRDSIKELRCIAANNIVAGIVERSVAQLERAERMEEALTALLATADECAWCEEPATHAGDDNGKPILTCDACAEPGHVELGRAAAVRAARAAIGAEHGMAVAKGGGS